MEQILLPVLLLIHVGGAIVGFGPTFAFAVMSAQMPRLGPEGRLAIMETTLAIMRGLVLPIAAVTQPLSGLALIFVAHYDATFFAHPWLWGGILLYAVAFYISIFQQLPTLTRMVAIVKAGPPTPEMAGLMKRAQRNGPIVSSLLGLVIMLMVTKLGG